MSALVACGSRPSINSSVRLPPPARGRSNSGKRMGSEPTRPWSLELREAMEQALGGPPGPGQPRISEADLLDPAVDDLQNPGCGRAREQIPRVDANAGVDDRQAKGVAIDDRPGATGRRDHDLARPDLNVGASERRACERWRGERYGQDRDKRQQTCATTASAARTSLHGGQPTGRSATRPQWAERGLAADVAVGR